MRDICLENNPTLKDRFWNKVIKTPMCWLWKGTMSEGYGQIHAYELTGRRINPGVHRISWFLHYGYLPTKKEIMHRCDVRNCVRPDHLRVGTHQENMQDCAQKGRIVSREIQTHCKNRHLYTPETFYRTKHGFGFRICRPCRQANRRRYQPQTRTYRRKRYALLRSQGLTYREAIRKH